MPSVTLSPILFVPLSTDLRGPRQLLQRGRLLPLSGLRLPLALPHPGHATVLAVQRGPVHSQGSGQVRGGFQPGRQSGCSCVSPRLAPVTTVTTAIWSWDTPAR